MHAETGSNKNATRLLLDRKYAPRGDKVQGYAATALHPTSEVEKKREENRLFEFKENHIDQISGETTALQTFNE